MFYGFTDPQGSETQRNDGKHTQYLTDKRFEKLRQCDPTLYQKLHRVFIKRRHLTEISTEGVLPTDTIYWDEPAEQVDLPPIYRSLHRQAYLTRAALAMREVELIFCDPDNGIGNPKMDTKTKGAGKSVFLDELKLLWKLGHSLLVYNHRIRLSDSAIQKRYQQLKSHFGVQQITIFRFRKGSQRDFILISKSAHRKFLKHNIAGFQTSGWVEQGLFEVFTV